MTPKSEVFNMDCIEGMSQYPDNHFELAIVDLPYGIGASKPRKKSKLVKQKNGSYLKVESGNYSPKDWDFELATDEYFKQLFRVSKNQIVFGANYYTQLAGGAIVWDKLNGQADQYGCEIAYQSFNKRTDVIHYMWCGMFQGLYCGRDIKKALVQQGNKRLNEKRIHPTQKPVKLYSYLLKNYAKQGDKILDTHLGSGSSRIAAFDMGFEFTGFELDSDYFSDQQDRFNRHINKQLDDER